MNIRLTLVLAAAFALCADIPDTHFRMPLPGAPDLTVLSESPSLPNAFVSILQGNSHKTSDMQLQSRLAIVRFVDGEFAKAVKPLPGGKQGYKFDIGKPLNSEDLQSALRHHRASVNPGDTVQITDIEFRSKEIVLQINGGGKKHFHLLEHLQIGMGDAANSAPIQDRHPNEGTGATLILDYGRPLPDMSPDDLKTQLAPILDFSKHSAAVNWIDTLPPQFQQAIKDRHAIVGMDREMVLAAMGRADHKVRERDANGVETEDWIYGGPPAKTVFVTFVADKVIRVKEFD